MVDMSFSPEAFSDSFPGFSPGQGGGDAPSTPSENFDLQSAIDAGAAAAAAAAAEAEAYARAGSDTALNDYLTARAAQKQYDIEPEEAVRSFADTEDLGKGGIFSNIKGFLTGKVADAKANPIPTIARTASSLVLGSGPLGILATGVGRAFWDMMTFDRTGAMLEKGMTMDEVNKQYAQEQADYISDAEANVDGPYIPPAATATQTQSQSSIPPAANPYLSSPNQYNVGGLDIQYPTRNSQNIIAPTDYLTAAATPLDYANVIAPPGTPYYRTMAAGGYVDRPLYPSPRITGR
jgi:hypothetical protein